MHPSGRIPLCLHRPRVHEERQDTAASSVGIFSFKRWGVGSLALLSLLTVACVLLLANWIGSHSTVVAVLLVVLLLWSAVIVTVKLTETMEPAKRRDPNVVGKAGRVVSEVTPLSPGVVRVGLETWSARSLESLEEGQQVTVLRKEGLFLWVGRRQTDAGTHNDHP